MNASRASRSVPPSLLISTAGVLAALGTLLLVHPSARTASSSAPKSTSRASAGPRQPTLSPPAAASTTPTSPEANHPFPTGDFPSGVPIPGDGPGADPAIQTMLQRSAPANLPPQQEQELLDLGERVWQADATGQDRAQWPSYFPDTTPPRTPYTHVHLQAAIARSVGSGQAEVRLVWAGADPSGQQADGRTTRLLFTRTAHGWEPVR